MNQRNNFAFGDERLIENCTGNEFVSHIIYDEDFYNVVYFLCVALLKKRPTITIIGDITYRLHFYAKSNIINIRRTILPISLIVNGNLHRTCLLEKNSRKYFV